LNDREKIDRETPVFVTLVNDGCAINVSGYMVEYLKSIKMVDKYKIYY